MVCSVVWQPLRQRESHIVGFCFSSYYHYTSAGIVVITAKTKSNTHFSRGGGPLSSCLLKGAELSTGRMTGQKE